MEPTAPAAGPEPAPELALPWFQNQTIGSTCENPEKWQACGMKDPRLLAHFPEGLSEDIRVAAGKAGLTPQRFLVFLFDQYRRGQLHSEPQVESQEPADTAAQLAVLSARVEELIVALSPKKRKPADPKIMAEIAKTQAGIEARRLAAEAQAKADAAVDWRDRVKPK